MGNPPPPFVRILTDQPFAAWRKGPGGANQTRRLLALAEIYDEQRRSLAAKVGGVGLRIVRDWVVRFKAEGPDGLLDRKASGPTRKLNDARLRALVDLVLRGAIPAVDGVVRWRLKDLVAWIHGEFGLSLDETTVGQKTKITRRWAKRGTRPRAPKNQRTKSA